MALSFLATILAHTSSPLFSQYCYRTVYVGSILYYPYYLRKGFTDMQPITSMPYDKIWSEYFA